MVWLLQIINYGKIYVQLLGDNQGTESELCLRYLNHVWWKGLYAYATEKFDNFRVEIAKCAIRIHHNDIWGEAEKVARANLCTLWAVKQM